MGSQAAREYSTALATLGHIAVGMAAARWYGRRDPPRPVEMARWMVLLSALSIMPDLDVIAFGLGIPYEHPFGHRGASHSLVFGAFCGLIAAGVQRAKGLPRARTWGIVVGVVVASHGVLDAFTDGGLGSALLWPISNGRYFAPWGPIPVAPIGLRFISMRGLYVLGTELLIFSPLLAYALWLRRRPPGRNQAPGETAD